MADIILKQMILDAPNQEKGYEEAITSIQNQISDFTSKQNSLQRICNESAENLENYLLNEKFNDPKFSMYKGLNYNQSLSQNGNLSDWKIYKLLEDIEPEYIAQDSFSCDGDESELFVEDFDVSILINEITRVSSTVKSSSFDGSVTTVILNDEILNEPLTSISEYEYSYIPGDDSEIDKHKNSWDFSHNYIVQPLGVSGTYGTLDNISQLNNAMNLLTQNKNKISSSISIFERFV